MRDEPFLQQYQQLVTHTAQSSVQIPSLVGGCKAMVLSTLSLQNCRPVTGIKQKGLCIWQDKSLVTWAPATSTLDRSPKARSPHCWTWAVRMALWPHGLWVCYLWRREGEVSSLNVRKPWKKTNFIWKIASLLLFLLWRLNRAVSQRSSFLPRHTHSLPIQETAAYVSTCVLARDSSGRNLPSPAPRRRSPAREKQHSGRTAGAQREKEVIPNQYKVECSPHRMTILTQDEWLGELETQELTLTSADPLRVGPQKLTDEGSAHKEWHIGG